SMDYEILILSRITEAYALSGDVREAIVEGLARSSSVITGAAMILVMVFVPGLFSQSAVMKEISLGIIAALLIDATVVRLLLVPSFMMLMGKWNWWNPWGK
ncbi:MAG TPA: MMPL family transporter, partial [Candidatus Obscuribacterales bacterium]